MKSKVIACGFWIKKPFSFSIYLSCVECASFLCCSVFTVQIIHRAKKEEDDKKGYFGQNEIIINRKLMPSIFGGLSQMISEIGGIFNYGLRIWGNSKKPLHK